MEAVEDEDSAGNLAVRKVPVNEAGVGHQDKRKVHCLQLSNKYEIDEFKDRQGHQKKTNILMSNDLTGCPGSQPF